MPVRGWVEVSQVYCKGCELCIHACPQNVLALDMEHITPKGYHPAVLIAEGCTGCAICAVVCPEAALTVFREVPSRPARPVKAEASLTAEQAGEGALDAA